MTKDQPRNYLMTKDQPKREIDAIVLKVYQNNQIIILPIFFFFMFFAFSDDIK